MPKEEWGVKRLCPNCSTRFYDLQKDPMTCPLCGHQFDLESLLNPKSRASITKKDESASEADVSDDIDDTDCLLYTSPSPRDQRGSRMPSSA